MTVLPQLDAFEETRWSREVELQRDSNAATQFLAEHRDYFNSDANSETMLGWLKFQRVPVTVKNLTIAFRVLSADGKLETPSVQQVDIEPEPVDAEGFRPVAKGIHHHLENPGMGQV